MALKRRDIKVPSLPQQVETSELLGGEVVVRGLLLSERMEVDQLNATASKARDGETEDQARARAGSQVIPRMLARCVVDDDGEALLSASEWDALGASNPGEIYRLFNVAMRLSGQDIPAIEKN